MIMIGESIRLFIAWLLLSVGMWKLAHKMDWKKKWMAWVPGLRYLGLADDLERKCMRMVSIVRFWRSCTI